jgi:ABC-type transport system substrate-binding protein
MGEAIAGYWEKIGVKTKIIPTEYATYRAMISKPNSPSLRNSVAPMRYGNRVLWDAAFHIAYYSKGLLTGTHDPAVDKRVDAILAEKDEKKLEQMCYDLALFLNKHFYQIPIGECGAIYVANPKKVTSWPHLSSPLSYDLYLEDLYRR